MTPVWFYQNLKLIEPNGFGKHLNIMKKLTAVATLKLIFFGKKNDKKRYLLPKRTATHHIVAELRLEFQQSLQNRLASYNLRSLNVWCT